MSERLQRTVLLLIVVALGWLLAPNAHAQAPPPPWEVVVERSELIVRARVVEPGRMGARVVAEETFLGTAPEGPFLVIGFSDGAMPPQGIEEKALRKDEIVWLFLQEWNGMRPGLDIPTWQVEGWDPVPGQTWATPSAIAGDVPMREGQARVRLSFGGFHHFAPSMPVDQWESLLRALIAKVHDNERDEAGLVAARACLDAGPSPQGLRTDEPPDLRCLAELSLRGDRSGDPRLSSYIDGSPMVVGAAAGLGAQSGDPAFDRLIRAAAVHDAPDAGMFMLSFGASGGEAQISRVVAPLLAASRQSAPYKGIPLMVLRDEQMRLRLLSILAAAPDPASKDLLLAEMRYLNARPMILGIAALESVESGSWVPTALDILEAGEISRSISILEALQEHRPASARERLLRFIERDDVDPGVIRMAIQTLGLLGDASVAQRIRARLDARLAFQGAWSDDRTDMVSVELAALHALEGAGAVDMAWKVARQYLGVPRSISDPAFREAWSDERSRLSGAALRSMPAGSSATVWVITEREQAFIDRGTRIVLVDANATGGVTRRMQQDIARVTGTKPERVRLCGPDPGGRVRCLRDKELWWEHHDRLIKPMLDTIGSAAGLTTQPAEHPDAEAGYWLALSRSQSWPSDLGVTHVFDDLWVERFYGPLHPSRMPPLLPDGLPPFDPDAPPRSQ